MSTKICSILILIYWLLSLSPCHAVGERPCGLLGNHPALSHRGRGTPAELVIIIMMVMMVSNEHDGHDDDGDEEEEVVEVGDDDVDFEAPAAEV